MRTNVLMLVVMLALSVAPARRAMAGPLAPAKASALRTVGSAQNDCPGFTGARAIDSTSNTDLTNGSFTVPAGSVFVITSWDWWAQFPGTTLAQAFLLVSNGTNNQTLSISSVPVDAVSLRAGTSVQTPDGLVVKSGQTACIFVGSATTQIAILHGFLAKDN